MCRIKKKLHDNSQGEEYAYGISENGCGRDPEKPVSGFVISSEGPLLTYKYGN